MHLLVVGQVVVCSRGLGGEIKSLWEKMGYIDRALLALMALMALIKVDG